MNLYCDERIGLVFMDSWMNNNIIILPVFIWTGYTTAKTVHHIINSICRYILKITFSNVTQLY